MNLSLKLAQGLKKNVSTELRIAVIQNVILNILFSYKKGEKT